MLPINISQADIETVKVQKKIHTCSVVRTRCLILWLRHNGFAPSQIATAADCHANTVTNVVKMYNNDGMKRILRVPSGTLVHQLSDRFDEVSKTIRQTGVHTLQ